MKSLETVLIYPESQWGTNTTLSQVDTGEARVSRTAKSGVLPQAEKQRQEGVEKG